jgi:alpha-L-rhamnosidase
MNSFNHYAFGAVGDWMYRTIAGIRLDEMAPGAKHVWIAPRPGGGLTRAKASLETPYGPLVSSWRLEDRRFVLDVTIPPNTTADVSLVNTTPDRVREDGRAVGGARQNGQDVVVTVGSGTYEFTVERP